ncbi:carnitine O-palmitoyltransferase 1, liver isoform isoform X2 [Daphnia magna]|uniref:carnitine O-palmitoyltransferase 1, liver isoform isoform X2 n=1 Tax=Daphnia magna TaxID=35525 RepID=UPI001E1BA8F8|nr:carnitine O-palmitoyltransferase 1, liver isoform isoform X2 [Daphnia magna]
MAEGHQAVAFSFAITHEGLDVNFDFEVIRLIARSAVRSWRKRSTRFQTSLKSSFFPGSLRSLVLTEAVFIGAEKSGYDVTFGLTDKLIVHFPKNSVEYRVLCSAILGLAGWTGVIFSLRELMRLLLKYHGWLYEERGAGRQVSLPTRAWLLAMQPFFRLFKPQLYSFQGTLPTLPVPALSSTREKYLRSVRPLLDDAQYARMEKLSLEFINGIGRKLQRYLYLKRMWSTNYVSDWWEEYVYLRGRSPIMVNSNFYGIDTLFKHPTRNQAARAANIIYEALLFRRAIERSELEPIMVQGTVPLCSAQYERVFNTTRAPGIETDRIIHLDDSTHIAVYCHGKYFKVPLYVKGRLLRPCELEISIQKVIDDDSAVQPGEEKLAALTAGDRVPWAKCRQEYFSKGINKVSLAVIEGAAFVVALDEEDFNFDPVDHTQLDRYGERLLYGKGYDRWFDKSFTLVIGKNGRVGFNAEHSWADAAVLAHMWEFVLAEDVLIPRYKEDGHCKGVPECIPPTPIRLRWEMPQACIDKIESSYQVALALLNDVDLRLLAHSAFGKGLMKKCRISPDAFIQMALQLAYYRDAGKFSLTYEASMTRLFREGRTETVRPCTIESSQWVKAMIDESISKEERIRLLRLACVQHQRGYQDAMCGKGIDRHLFCLYVVSKYLEVDSPFLKEVLSEPWRLSTSQTPHGQTSKLDLAKHPDCISAGGGFGPVADDGYGVSYIIAGENLIFFHISSKRSSPETDSNRFAQQITNALADIKELFGL